MHTQVSMPTDPHIRTHIFPQMYTWKFKKKVFSYFLKYSQVWVQRRCNKQPIFSLCDKKTDRVTSSLSSLCVGTSKGLRQRCIGYGIVTQDHEKKVLDYDNCPEYHILFALSLNSLLPCRGLEPSEVPNIKSPHMLMSQGSLGHLLELFGFSFVLGAADMLIMPVF